MLILASIDAVIYESVFLLILQKPHIVPTFFIAFFIAFSKKINKNNSPI